MSIILYSTLGWRLPAIFKPEGGVECAAGFVSGLAGFFAPFIENDGMNGRKKKVFLGVITFLTAVCSAGADPITLRSLLEEMITRDALARFPSPTYRCKQFSSYDRATTSIEKQDTWFANGDAGHYLRVEETGGRKEFVMMDAQGPGAVVRIWSANPAGTLRIYLDGSSTPVIEARLEDLLGGKASIGSVTIGAPLAAVRSRGWNLYLPIPYAQSCKITSDAGGFYYQINYREYEAGTQVLSFKPETVAEVRDVLERVQQTLVAKFELSQSIRDQVNRLVPIPPNENYHIELRYPGAVTELAVRISADDLDAATRTTVLAIRFDDKWSVWVPLSEFFATGVGINPFSDWWRTVEENGTMWCRWVMPYQRKAELILYNLSGKPIKGSLAAKTIPWKWDNRSMYFRATWRQEYPLKTRPMKDWNYVEVKGKGVFVGDTLSVMNPVPDWWGEGDEKIYVDGETFPSHIGTGTEDYYGYAWCCPEPFQAPFHAQTRCDGYVRANNWGHTTVSRVRSLDAIPFNQAFKFDIEAWHWADCEVAYSAAAYFYAMIDATSNRRPQPEEVQRGLFNPPPPFKIAGAIECEQMKVLASAPNINVGPQGMMGFKARAWSNESQLWIQGQKAGDFVELRVPVDGTQPVKVTLYATKSWDYGIVRIFVNGQRAGEDVDLFSGKEGTCLPTGAIDLGTFSPVNGGLTLRIEVVGSNPQSLGTKSFFGLDCVVLSR